MIIPFLEALNDNVLKIYVSSFFPSGLPLVPFPSLEWPLPSKSGPYELLLHQQPRSHHRAQYETEGSRGAVKTTNGGHPEVQVLLFIILEKNAQKWGKKSLSPHTPGYANYEAVIVLIQSSANVTGVLELILNSVTDVSHLHLL